MGLGGLYPGSVGFARKGRRGGGPKWTVDATSGIATPADATEWAAFIAANGLSIAVPDYCWGLQETSGNASDSIGGNTLTASGTLTYQSIVSGWSRKGIRTTQAVAGMLQATTAMPVGTTSGSILEIVSLPVTSAERGVLYLSNSASHDDAIDLMSTGKLNVIVGASGTQTADSHVGVRPLWHVYSRTNGSADTYSDIEHKSSTFTSSVMTSSTFFGHTSVPAGETHLYAVGWKGTNADMTATQVKAVLQAMGYTISWT